MINLLHQSHPIRHHRRQSPRNCPTRLIQTTRPNCRYLRRRQSHRPIRHGCHHHQHHRQTRCPNQILIPNWQFVAPLRRWHR